jgi:hypothetical protein
MTSLDRLLVIAGSLTATLTVLLLDILMVDCPGAVRNVSGISDFPLN